jgi:gliding motility-associated-like protein
MIKKYLSQLFIFLFILNIAHAQSNIEDNELEIPNVFTPNNDKKNDFFQIKTNNISQLKVEIFNRWGNKIAEIKGINDYWDGRATSDEELPVGNYFYRLVAKNKDGNEIIKNGVVLLLR